MSLSRSNWSGKAIRVFIAISTSASMAAASCLYAFTDHNGTKPFVIASVLFGTRAFMGATESERLSGQIRRLSLTSVPFVLGTWPGSGVPAWMRVVAALAFICIIAIELTRELYGPKQRA